ncbi:hypothetical protein MRX96_031308 [Rhipicephalus microplus]
MSAEEIRSLCSIFYLLRFEELHALDFAGLPWLMPLKGHTLLQAVEIIYASVVTIEGKQERLCCMAKLYAWLVPRGVFAPWVLYRLNTSEAASDVSAFGERLEEAVKFSGRCAEIGVVDTGSCYSVTVLMASDARGPPEYVPVCFCVWPGLPFVAYHAAEGASYSYLLKSAFGNADKSLCGTYADLDSALTVAIANQ